MPTGTPLKTPMAGPATRSLEHAASVVELRGITKSYAGVQALRGVDLALAAGSIHALVGENGAGKSTLAKIISGVLLPDGGQLRVDGAPVTLRSPRRALDLGIATIEQEVSLVGQLSAEDNVYLGAEPRRAGFIRRRELSGRYRELAGRSGFAIAPQLPAGSAPLAVQQQIEILRAISRRARVVVMDEPTASLDRAEAKALHGTIRELRDSATTVVLVSHRLGEVLQLADMITVLRDGQVVRSGPAAAETEDSLIHGMLGRELSHVLAARAAPSRAAAPMLITERLRAPGVFDTTLQVGAGEIVALAGLAGSGRSELAGAIYGSARRHGGSIAIGERRMQRASPREARAHGVFLVPESRKDDGLVLQRSVVDNVCLGNHRGIARCGFVRRRDELAAVRRLLIDLGIPADRHREPVANLSGGNQQKVVFARGLLGRPKVLIADEPTRGVDVGAKATIYALLRAVAADGVAVLFISSDIEEVIGLADRVLVLHEGRISAQLSGPEITEEAIVAASFGRRGPNVQPGAPAGGLASEPAGGPAAGLAAGLPEPDQGRQS